MMHEWPRHLLIAALFLSLAQTRNARSAEPVQAEHDILYADAKWCGPRVLYFFACLLGSPDIRLDTIAKLCETDQDGSTSLFDLVRAAETLKLRPVAVSCSVDDMLRSGKPAIICLGSGVASERQSQERVHFVGVFRPRDDGPIWVIDPSRRTAPFPAEGERLLRAFTGRAVFLGGALPTIYAGRRLSGAVAVVSAILGAALAVALALRATGGRTVPDRR